MGAAFLDIENDLLARYANDIPPLQQYLQHLQFMISGFAVWQVAAERYRWKNLLSEDRIQHRVRIAWFSES